jgi:type IV pilus assembly protein PilB
MGISDKDLYQTLLKNQYLSEAELKKAQDYAKSKEVSLYDSVIENDLISDNNLGEVISDYLQVPLVTLSKINIAEDILRLIPEHTAKTQRIIAFGAGDGFIKVATSNPHNTEAIQMISRKAQKKVQIYYATDRDIEDALGAYKKELQKTFDDLLKEQVIEAGKAVKKEAPVAKIVDTLIEYAYYNKASDIHIEPGAENSLIRFRIDGVLHDVLKIPKELHEQVVSRIKVLARLRTDEHMSAQDGKMILKLEHEDLDIRVSIVPIVEGEKTVLRLLTSHFRQFGLADLGMNESDLNKVKKGFMRPYGMVLSTGPTGAGKSTTMYAILKLLNTREKNIATIEDPVEYKVQGLNQIQVNPKTNLTFASGLRSLLRQDPDIIYVGEIRDDETADIAINSAMTGHLVLSTLHTNDSATALPRLLDMQIEPFLVSSTVNVIVAQRLVRKICESCKVTYTKKAEELSKLINPAAIKEHLGKGAELRMYKGKGCNVCHGTGYSGRVGLYEVLDVTEGIQGLINKKADSDEIMKKAVSEGMTTMLEDGLDKVQQGVTSIEEIMRATKE